MRALKSTSTVAAPSRGNRPAPVRRTPSRHALAEDADARRRLTTRLRRIEGQVRGLQKMVEEERYCPDILRQVEAVQASLGAVAELLLRGHLRHCVANAVRAGETARTEELYTELAELYRRSRS